METNTTSIIVLVITTCFDMNALTLQRAIGCLFRKANVPPPVSRHPWLIVMKAWMTVSCARLIETFQTEEVETISTTVVVTIFSATLVRTRQHLIRSGVLGLHGRLVLWNVEQVPGHEPATVLGADV